ncbi:MAG: prolyl oligopeptidase family serine peptidase [Sphingomonadales bacterium]
MKLWTLFLTALLLSSLASMTLKADEPRLAYPPAARGEVVDVFHGVEVPDPYRWLEDMKSEEVARWVDEQEKLTRGYLADPAREAIEKRIHELAVYRFVAGVIPRGEKDFAIRGVSSTPEATLYVRNRLSGEEIELLKAPYGVDLGAANAKSVQFRGMRVDRQGNNLAIITGLDNLQWRQVGILNSETGKVYAEMLTGLHSLNPAITWNVEGSGFYYVSFEPAGSGAPGPEAPKNARIMFHALGTPQTSDKLVFGSLSANWVPIVSLSSDGRYLVVKVFEGGDVVNRVFIGDIQKRDVVFTPWFADRPGGYSYLGSRGSEFWFYTSFEAPQGRIVKIDALKPVDQPLVEIVAEQPEALFANSLVGGNAIGMFADKLVLMYSKAGLPSLKVFDLAGAFLYEVDLPEGGSIWGGLAGEWRGSRVLYRILDLFSPATVYELDVATGKTEIAFAPEVSINAAPYVSKQVFFKSADGTRVPMLLVHRKDIKLDGSNPAFMYGYGAYGWVSFLWYQPHVIAWLEAGGIYAQPALRGGGEMGKSWWDAGKGINKPNTIDDYIAAAEWLVREGYTSPAKLIANGGSLSGFLPAVAINRRPDMFAGAVMDIPIFDLLREAQFSRGTFWSGELGTPDDRAEFEVLKSYSPYHNLRVGTCYPATLINFGEEDSNALPLHSYKYAAALQHAQKCGNPILLNPMRGAGHNYGNSPEQVVQSRTDQLIFSMRATGMLIGQDGS